MSSSKELIDGLNRALGWELRASVMYAHYAAYVGGIHRLHLATYFQNEATESNQHAQMVRDEIVKLGGIAVTDRDTTEIVHGTGYKELLAECLKTEKVAASTYRELLKIVGDDSELYDTIQQIAFAEERSVAELEQLIE